MRNFLHIERAHSIQVAKYSAIICEHLAFTGSFANIAQRELLYDIGKVGIRDELLMKPGKLTRDAFEVVPKHPEIGAEIIALEGSSSLIAPLILHHHERPDGIGYPPWIKRYKYSPWCWNYCSGRCL